MRRAGSGRRFVRAVALCGAVVSCFGGSAAAGPDAIGGNGNDPTVDETVERGRAVAVEPGLGIAIFPIPISNPTIGTGLGLAASVLYQTDEKSAPSYTGIGALATSNRTWGVGAVQYLSLDEDRYRISLGLGYASVKYDFFGAGNNAGSRGISIPIRQDGYFTNPWAQVRVAEDLYFGLQYRLIQATTQIDSSDLDGPLGRLLEGRQVDFISSGAGPIMDWDTRDDPFWTRSGHLLHAEAIFASGEMFSDFNYRKGLASFNVYREVFDEGILAARVSGCFSGGEVPVVDLCLFGAHNDLRGYQAGRYRDENSWAAQVEQRWKFADRWGVVAFAGAGAVTEEIGEAFSNELLGSGGLGLRFQVSKSYEVNLALDGVVNLDGDTSLYFRIGEAF